MIAQVETSSRSPSRPATLDHAERSTVGGVAKVVEIEDPGRRMVRDLEAFLSEALRPSNESAWLPGRRIIGCAGFSCPRCRSIAGNSVAEVESC
jgi:hypothetical protein